MNIRFCMQYACGAYMKFAKLHCTHPQLCLMTKSSGVDLFDLLQVGGPTDESPTDISDFALFTAGSVVKRSHSTLDNNRV